MQPEVAMDLFVRVKWNARTSTSEDVVYSATPQLTSYLNFINYERVVMDQELFTASIAPFLVSVKLNLKLNMKCPLFLATVVKLSAESVRHCVISYFLC